MAWSPHNHNLLVTGGGTTDKTIKFWNTSNFKLQKTIDTG
jgi:cell division cycle 20-like protein 1 (cofactor of APC complex)